MNAGADDEIIEILPLGNFLARDAETLADDGGASVPRRLSRLSKIPSDGGVRKTCTSVVRNSGSLWARSRMVAAPWTSTTSNTSRPCAKLAQDFGFEGAVTVAEHRGVLEEIARLHAASKKTRRPENNNPRRPFHLCAARGSCR